MDKWEQDFESNFKIMMPTSSHSLKTPTDWFLLTKENMKNSWKAAYDLYSIQTNEELYHLSAWQCVHPENLSVEEGRDAVFCKIKDQLNDLSKAHIDLQNKYDELVQNKQETSTGGTENKVQDTPKRKLYAVRERGNNSISYFINEHKEHIDRRPEFDLESE